MKIPFAAIVACHCHRNNDAGVRIVCSCDRRVASIGVTARESVENEPATFTASCRDHAGRLLQDDVELWAHEGRQAHDTESIA